MPRGKENNYDSIHMTGWRSMKVTFNSNRFKESLPVGSQRDAKVTSRK